MFLMGCRLTVSVTNRELSQKRKVTVKNKLMKKRAQGSLWQVTVLAFIMLCVVCVNTVYAGTLQNGARTVEGVVLDVEGEPLAGVTVVLKGNNAVGTITDMDGKYQIRVQGDNDVLTFSYIGYATQEIAVRDSRSINVVLRESSVLLEDVVVVGYGTQKKVSITGALSTVDVNTIISVPSPTFTNALAGHLPGLITRQTSGEPGFDAAQIYIRGRATFNGATTPLVLVDGIERDINLVNSHEVESFSILKDASATAVYGVKGANGVILINTRKGQKTKPQIQVRTEWATLRGMRFPNYIEGWEFASLMNEASANEGKPLPWTDEDISLFRDGSDPYMHPNVNWMDEVYKKNSDQSTHNITVSGGNETVRYYVNAGYMGQGGLYREDPSLDYRTNARLNRYSFRSNVDVNLFSNFVLDIGLGAVIDNRNYQGTPAQTIYNATKQISPINYPVRNPDGSPAATATSYTWGNPWALTTQSGYTNMYRHTLQGTFGFKWDLSKVLTQGLSLGGKFAFDTFNHAEIFRQISFELKQYLGPDPETGEDRYTILREPGPMGSSLSTDANRSTYYELTANYDRSFGRHTLAGMLLLNRREYIHIAGDEIENIPNRRQGLVGRLTYNYDSRYLMEFNFGYNGSEQFPKGQRYGFFPAVSAGWFLSNESFWGMDLINNLKIRGSVGQVGNDQIGGRRFLYQTRMDKYAWTYYWGESQSYHNNAGIQEGQIGTTNVTWETATKSNIGLDLDLWRSFVSLQVDLFYEFRDHILLERASIPVWAGYISNAFGNLGQAENRGIDGKLEIKKTTASGLFYSFLANYTFARNKILKNDDPKPLYDYSSRIGRRIGEEFGLVALGFFQDEADIANSPQQTFAAVVYPGDIKYKDVNEDGKVDDYDRVPIGYGQTPEAMFGFGGTVAFKGFDASLFFTGVTNRSTFLDGMGMMPYELEYPNYNIFREYYDNRWIPGAADNSGAKYPAVIAGKNTNNYRLSTLWMKDASYLRLQNAEIGYTLPQSLTRQFRIDKIRFFINGTNLHVWDHVKIVDPEMWQTGAYPMQRVINFGAQFNF
jgi:TonB-linked SusC/RagA family outer membrane protein